MPRPSRLLVFVLVGALSSLASGCLIVETGDQPGEPGACAANRSEFQAKVMPLLLDNPAYTGCRVGAAGAGACHDVQSGRSAFRLADPVDPATIAANHDRAIRFLNCSSPGDSALLTKPLSGRNNHGGGDLIPTADEAAVTAALRAWAGVP